MWEGWQTAEHVLAVIGAIWVLVAAWLFLMSLARAVMARPPRHVESQIDLSHVNRKLDGLSEAVTTIQQTLENLMSAISDFAAKQAAHNQAVSDDLDAISTKIDTLNALIAILQNSSGTISAEDQATLNSIDAAGQDLATKADALAGKTPPAPPAA